jgi:hypothetical protein
MGGSPTQNEKVRPPLKSLNLNRSRVNPSRLRRKKRAKDNNSNAASAKPDGDTAPMDGHKQTRIDQSSQESK